MKGENEGWARTHYPDATRFALACLRERSGKIVLRWERKSEEEEVAVSRARDAAQDAADKEWDAEAWNGARTAFLKRGAKLSLLTQSLACEHIKRLTHANEKRPATVRMIKNICSPTQDAASGAIPEARLWKMIRKREVRRRVRDFLWKCLHDAVRVGKYWRNIPTMEERERCAWCGATESIQHILVECSATHVDTVWGLVLAAATKAGETGLARDARLALGGHALEARDLKSKNAGAARLLRIIVPESMHLIWRLRCTWVIEHEGDRDRALGKEAVSAMWHAIINERLHVDQAMQRLATESQPLQPLVVRNTWGTLIDNVEAWNGLPWERQPGVLVGRLVPEYSDGVG
ncbi:hypothetical protein C8Q76DRAFT_635284 [Earliella scabrosa]|nr:hypothetical protein C8Q76DRAFT_635284 [Earliella scabrosa]